MGETFFVGLDTETHLFRRGYATPRLVCMTLAFGRHAPPAYLDIVLSSKHAVHRGRGYLLDRVGTSVAWRLLLDDPDANLVIHNSEFDLRVLMALCPDRVGDVFGAVDAGRVWDTMRREKLIALSHGNLQFRIDPFTKTKRPTAVNLADLAMRYLGIDRREAKDDPASPRKRFHEMDGRPLSEWPAEFVAYAIEDAADGLECLYAQEETHPEDVDGHPTRGDEVGPDGVRRIAGEHFTVNGVGGGEVRAAVSLALMGSWGLRTCPEQVPATLAAWTELSDAGKALGTRLGFIRAQKQGSGKVGTVNQTALRILIAQAYGGRVEKCAQCNGQGYFAPTGRQRVNQGCKACKWVGSILLDTGDAPLTDTGQVSTSEEVLVASNDDDLEEYAKSLSATNWLGKYGPILEIGLEVPVTYQSNSLVSTGRTSLRNPPMQQPPREGGFRDCFIPRKGFLYASADYNQVELRTLAQVQLSWGLGDELAQAFRDGMDPHVLMAVDILNAEEHEGPPVDFFGSTGWTYALGMECLKDVYGPKWRKVIKTYRQMAKAANFGFPGGLGPRAFVAYAKKAYGVVITEERAQELRDLWYARWPAMRPYFDVINDLLGFGESFTARQPISMRLRGDCGYCDGANTFFQGTAADGFKAAAWALQVECWTGRRVEGGDERSPLYGARPVLPLHDEFVVEVPESRAAEAAERLAFVMKYCMQAYIPDVPIEAEAALMRRWYKDADPVYVDGRLVPWEPQ